MLWALSPEAAPVGKVVVVPAEIDANAGRAGYFQQ